ncbi:MAG TPA: protein-glutamate O-methyltransferase CheR, partial [Trichocoleus sp.]
NIHSYQNYLQYLQSHPKEHVALLNDVLINVTSFFRDSEAWEYLTTEILPKIIASKQPDEPIRVWSAGCATGQEIYSLLILLAEQLGFETCLERVQGYATDLDENALALARKGFYREFEVKSVPPDLLQKYFEPTEEGYVFSPALRRVLVFGHHDLAQDAPMSKLDLLMCRNVLIYCNAEVQTSILARFHFAVRNTGFLFLGKAEALAQRRAIFTPVNLPQRVYKKELKLELEDYLSINSRLRKTSLPDSSKTQTLFWQTAYESSPTAQILVNITGDLVSANEQATLWFGLTLGEQNCSFQDSELANVINAYSIMKPFYCSRCSITLRNIEWDTGGVIRYFDVAIAPVFNAQRYLLGVTLTFVDSTTNKHLNDSLKRTQNELRRVTQMLERAESQLDAARLELAATQQEILLLSSEIHQAH